MPLKRILENYKKGKISLEDAEKEVRLFSMAKISNWSNLDICRENRTGVPEVVFGEGKTDEELVRLVNEFVKRKGRCIITRLSSSRIAALKKKIKKMSFAKSEKAGVVVVKSRGYKLNPTGGKIAILCAGTSDVARAEEARIISEEMGCSVFTFYDVGVAGKEDVDVVIAAAGMEGALPSVVAGLVDVPVIGLPISTGYGAGGRGETALFAMLQSCSPGLSVVNIDNGFGAGVVASLIASRAAKFRCSPASLSP